MHRAGPPAFSGPVRHVYVHVPFCRAKCDYCDFASKAMGDAPDGELLDAYVEGVAAEWERERAAHDVRRLLTLYLGGGTPSLLGPERLARLLDVFRPFLTPGAEVTVEANPEDVDARFAGWAGTAVGGPRARRPARISLGVQSFSPRLRAAVGRRAGADPAAAVARLRAAGVDNLSVDLMWGLPGQSAADLEDDLGAVLALRPAHISWYELSVVEGTPLARRLGQPQLTAPAACAGPMGAAIPSADERAAMYRRIVRALQRAGYNWYEVSNHALPGRRARHNVAYWRARPYLGLGPGAVSTVAARRWTNLPEVAAWRARLAAGAPPPRELELLDPDTRAREQLMLAARCGLRLPLSALRGVLDERAAAALAGAGLVSLAGATILVTRKGRYVADEVCVRLFRA